MVHQKTFIFLGMGLILLGTIGCNSSETPDVLALLAADQNTVNEGTIVHFDATESNGNDRIRWSDNSVSIPSCDDQLTCSILMAEAGAHFIGVNVFAKQTDNVGKQSLISDETEIAVEVLPLPAVVAAPAPAPVAAPIGNATPPNYAADAKATAKKYLELQTRNHRDSFGALLPTKTIGGVNSFDKQGDALTWNAVALASYCILQKQDPSFALSGRITEMWQMLNTQFITQGTDLGGAGRPFRHPSKKNEDNTFSPDMMTAFFYLGAIAFQYNCEPIKSEYVSKWLIPFKNYGMSHGFNFKAPGTSTDLIVSVTKRDLLDILLHLYGQNRNGTSFDENAKNLARNAQRFDNDRASQVTRTLYDCYGSFVSPTTFELLDPNHDVDCGGTPNKETEVIMTHLNFLSMVIMRIEALHQSAPFFGLDETADRLKNLSKVGTDINQPNWLFIAGFRALVTPQLGFDDVNQSLSQDWPKDHLPVKQEAIKTRGCTEYQWQLVGPSRCDGSPIREWTGIDFLHAKAWSL